MYDILTKLPFDPDIMTLLKQGSLSETEKSMEKKKKSIHERLQINKEIIAKKQGKGNKEKGVEITNE